MNPRLTDPNTQLHVVQETDVLSAGRVSHPASETKADVAILMCTYNGGTFLVEQLESFASQSFDNWVLYVSDDGSTDGTRAILSEYQTRWGAERLHVFDGPRQGFAKNFISLLKRVEIRAQFYAFSDQDDVWFADKLERSVACLVPLSAEKPALYCSRTRLVDDQRRMTGFSPLFSRPPSFQNALVQSLAGANTMVINQAACDVISQLPTQASIVAHDWLAYLIVTGCGGTVFYDPQPTLEYRQHGDNVIGANNSARDRLKRVRKMLSGRFATWNDANIDILRALSPLLTQNNRLVLERFEQGRKAGLVPRLRALHSAGIYRQTPAGNITLLIAALLARI